MRRLACPARDRCTKKKTDAELAALAEGVSSLTVDVSPASPSKGKGAAEGDAEAEALQPDSPDYNDINFWKPSMNWYSK